VSSCKSTTLLLRSRLMSCDSEPVEFKDAQAEYIVVDDSSLTVDTSFTLALMGSAQSNIKGMNVVNATGSAVADGVNIARTSGLANGGVMNLTQSNVINHSR